MTSHSRYNCRKRKKTNNDKRSNVDGESKNFRSSSSATKAKAHVHRSLLVALVEDPATVQRPRPPAALLLIGRRTPQAILKRLPPMNKPGPINRIDQQAPQPRAPWLKAIPSVRTMPYADNKVPMRLTLPKRARPMRATGADRAVIMPVGSAGEAVPWGPTCRVRMVGVRSAAQRGSRMDGLGRQRA